MSKKKMLRNSTAILLSALMTATLPSQVIASTLPQEEKLYSSFDNVQGNAEIVSDIVTELKNERTANTKKFLLEDGTKMIAEYDLPVHFKNDKGNWVEYDNSLVAENSTSTADESTSEYSNKKSNINIKLSSKAKSNNMIKVTSDDYSISWGYDSISKSRAEIIENTDKLVGNDKFTTLKNLTQEAKYCDVYENIDLQYFVSSTGIKENIILKNSDVQNEFNITYKIKNLTAKQTDDYSITLYNKSGKAVYTIVAPYMMDAKGNSSNQLKLELVSQKGSNLNVKLTADYWFIHSIGRSFPITIDPEVTTKPSSKLSLYEGVDGGFNSYGPYYLDNTDYIIAKVNSLPTLEDGERIISAKFNFEATNYSTLFANEEETPIIINAHKLTNLANNTVPQYEADVIDYDSLTYNDNKDITFDLTKLMNEWYENGDEIDGFVLEAFDTVGSKQINLQNDTHGSVTPSWTLTYKDFTGTESHLTYHTVEVGNKAQASVSDYLGNLVINQNLYDGTGSRMPVTLTATYNSINYDKTFANGSPSGYGWQFSFNQYVRDADETLANLGYSYIYTDSDGTDHYLKKSEDAEEWYDEDDLGITLTKTDTNILIDNGSTTQTYELTTAGGKLISEKDEYNNTISYTYTNGNLIGIEDGSGRDFVVEYSTNNRVSNIKLPDDNIIYFNYNDTDRISSIVFPDNRISKFEYDTNGRMISVKQADTTTGTEVVNAKTTFTYNTKALVTKIAEYGSDNTEGNYLNIAYGNDNTTVFTDRQERSVTYTFDNAGNQISVLNANGYLESTDTSGLSFSSGADSFTKNYITESTEFNGIGSSEYYYKLNGSTYGTTSSGGACSIDSSDPTTEDGYYQYFGETSLKITNPVTEDNSAFYTGLAHQFTENDIDDNTFNSLEGKDVTFSAYVKTKDVSVIENYNVGAVGAILKIKYYNEDGTTKEYNSIGITETQDWQRISVTTTIPETATHFRIFCMVRNSTGTAWFDCLQLEEGNCANDFNALQNSNFETDDYWETEENAKISPQNGTVTLNGTADAYDDTTTSDEENNEEPDEEIEDEAEVETYYVTEPETSPHDVVISYDNYGNEIKTEQGFVERMVKKTYEVSSATEPTEDSGSNESETTEPESTNSTDPVPLAESLGNKYIYQNVLVGRAGVNFKIVGQAEAKSVPLTNENRTFGIALNIYYDGESTPETHYQEFNDDCDKKQTVSLSVFPEYDDKVIEHIAFAFVYGYNKNEMKAYNAMLNISSNVYTFSDSTTTEEDTNTENEEETEETTEEEDNYIDYEVISETVDTTKTFMKTETAYDDNNNYAISETNESGNTFTYTYDTNGNVTSVKNPYDDVVSYAYDNAGNVTSVSSYDAQNTYSYNGAGYISAINHNSFTYQFNYDVFNNLISTKIGNVALATNTYSPNDGNLIKTTYANGDYFEYTYDEYDNVTKVVGYTKETNTKKTIAEFVYNKKGLVAKAVDKSSGRTTFYYYDFDGNQTKEFRQASDESLSSYIYYDEEGNPVEKTSINGYVKTITSGTDDDGNAYVSNDGITISTVTDDFGRATSVETSRGEGNSVFFTNYEYASGKETNSTTNLVSKMTHKYGTEEIVSYGYDYDDTDYIMSFYENDEKIVLCGYDELDQLTSLADATAGMYTFINYDNAGNITSVAEHEMSETGWVKGAEIATKTYTYGDEVWKDKLTAYNGQAIFYDASGNPLTYRDGMTFTWEQGRNLKKITTNTNRVEMMYDSNAMRTQKKVRNPDGEDIATINYYYDSNNNLIGLSNGDDTLFFYYDTDGNPISFAHNGTMYYYIKNILGDITKIMAQDGTIVANYLYDYWGKILSITDDTGATISVTNHIAHLNPFRYRGYVFDDETGLYYLQSRYYDPVIGRFVNADVYCDTLTGTPLSTNMFAYCENNSIMKHDKEGTDAWWIQSPTGAKLQGHTSLLIQEKPGYWWYFYWGDDSIQLFFIGTTTQKNIDVEVENTINRYNKEFNINLEYGQKYTKSIRFKGDFTGTYNFLIRYINTYKNNYKKTKIYKMRFNSDNDTKNKKGKNKNRDKHLSNSYHKYYKGKLRPESLLIKGNKRYDLWERNCMQISSTALSYGKVKNVNYSEYNRQMLALGGYVRPNTAYRHLVSFNYGKEVIT